MKCKFCNAELNEGATECKACGKKIACSGTKKWQLVLGIVAAGVLLASLAILLLSAFGVKVFSFADKHDDFIGDTVPTGTTEDASVSAMPDIDTSSAVADDEEAIETSRNVVAMINDAGLTNGLLRILYRMAVVDFINENYDYLTYYNLDLNKPLSEQVCYEDNTISWEQYFINAALDSWSIYQSVYTMAMDEGFVPSDEILHELEELPEAMETMAKEENLENGDALIADRFGTGCTVEDYLTYFTLYYISSEYVNITPTAQQLEDYYAANADMFESYGIGKDSGPIVAVRHILITPKLDSEEQTEPTQQQWDACLDEAESLYKGWKNGAATEESFALLADQYSEDGGSNTNGGLYSGITRETTFVEPFLNWCIDENRKVGDSGIVKTNYGYHIMYFCDGVSQWEYYANSYFLSEHVNQKIEEAQGKWPMEVFKDKIVLADLKLN